MRFALVLLAACSADPIVTGPDADGPIDDDAIVWVEDGTYGLRWQDTPPAGFAGCDSLSILGTEVEFLGTDFHSQVEHSWRGNCLCANDWCLCPNVGSLYAEIRGVPVRVVPD